MSTIFYLHFKEQSRYHHPQETFPAIQIWVRYFSYLILSPLYCYDTGYNSYLIICLSDRLQAFRAQDPSLSTSLVSQSLVQSPHEFWMENTFLNCSSIHFFLVSQMSTGHEGLGNAFSSFPIGGSEKGLVSGRAGGLRDPFTELSHFRNRYLNVQRDDMILCRSSN